MVLTHASRSVSRCASVQRPPACVAPPLYACFGGAATRRARATRGWGRASVAEASRRAQVSPSSWEIDLGQAAEEERRAQKHRRREGAQAGAARPEVARRQPGGPNGPDRG